MKERGWQWLERVNDRYPWSHNEHFHGWVLRNRPIGHRQALDVGCGAGVLVAKLSGTFTHVIGVDVDPGMAQVAGRLVAGNERASIHLSTFADFASTADDETFDLITMVASLHHLDLRETLKQVTRLLAPGGRLLVVGLAQPTSRRDLATDLTSVALNPIVGWITHRRRSRAGGAPAQDHPAMPVKEPVTSMRDLADAVRTTLPGYRLRRRLFFRYTLLWEKPA